MLTTAKLDAAGQCWVASLVNYNFKLHYKMGKKNVEADVLLCNQWECATLDEPAVKAIIDMGCTGWLAGAEACPGLTPPAVSSLQQSVIGCRKVGVSATKITPDE